MTRPCIGDTTELLADDARPLLCWGKRCLTDPGNLASGVPRPPAAGEAEDAIVDGGRVCTGARCDRIGLRFGAAMAAMTDPTVEATRDHAALVLAGTAGDEASVLEVWNRAADRKIDLGSPDEDEGAIAKVTVLGDLLIVTRECMSKGCIPSSRIVDARGRRHGDISEPEAATITGLAAGQRVVRGAFDEVVMLDHGRITATASLADDQTVRLDDHVLAVLRCSGGDPDTACHLLWRRVETDELGGTTAEITTADDYAMPQCPAE